MQNIDSCSPCITHVDVLVFIFPCFLIWGIFLVQFLLNCLNLFIIIKYKNLTKLIIIIIYLNHFGTKDFKNSVFNFLTSSLFSFFLYWTILDLAKPLALLDFLFNSLFDFLVAGLSPKTLIYLNLLFGSYFNNDNYES